MIDNTNVVVLHGSGADAVITPEMVDFGRRFGFTFIAHAIGDANRSARVERRFHHAENNFLVGRTFADFADLNAQAETFCDRINHKTQRRLKASPMEVFPIERQVMSPLPPVIPPVYRVAYRVVDLEGFIHVGANTYSVPYELIGSQLEIRESLSEVRVYHGPREAAVHARVQDKRGKCVIDKRHRPKRRRNGRRSEQPIPEEGRLRAADPVLDSYVDKLRSKHPGRGAAALRRLHRMYNEYPRDSFMAALREADKYGMLDLSRLEKMVLKALAGRFFPHQREEDEDER
jgi:hypothetical protein